MHSILPRKRPFLDLLDGNPTCVSCLLHVHSDLTTLFAKSPFSNLLQLREFVSLTDDVCNILNRDWEFFPQVKFFSALVFAGAILVNTRNQQAIMINTIKMFGRTRCVDQHREPSGKIKHGVLYTSHPPPFRTIHRNVWPVSLETRDGHKLVIGTQVSNALVTSSIRLDEKHPPSIGGMTSNFALKTIQDSLACKLFLDTERLNKAQSSNDRLWDFAWLAQFPKVTDRGKPPYNRNKIL